MFHEISDIEREKLRLSRRPGLQDAPPILCVFDVRNAVPFDVYRSRVRAVLDAALGLAISEPFEDEDLPVDGVPDWFASVSGGGSGAGTDFARHGAERYVAGSGNDPWELQEWLYEFDPESETRGWAWWDLTSPGEGSARVWVDSWGESFFACDELRWLVLVAGAEEVRGPELVPASAWIEAIGRDR
ncbi:hypothetical protein [Streptomyces sp. NPDC005865]|uniref:hypothetical protein n=1 Tax=Streptomyces sp. NPDC005865 TaxID=3155453 RepID=UPI0033FD3C40